MGKLQPNFSFKYNKEPTTQRYSKDSRGIVSGAPKDQAGNSAAASQDETRFQYELAQEHVQVANSVNATIDDSSYFTSPRQTSFTWVNGAAIYTLTLATGALNAGTTTLATGISGNFLVVGLKGAVSNSLMSSGLTLPLPYVDPVTAANSIGLLRQGTNILITSGGTNYSAYSGWVTIYYIQEP